MMRMAAMILAAAMLAACPAADEENAVAPATENSAVPAPTPDDVAIRIGAEQNGQSVDVAVNQRFAIELVGTPTAGYVWEPAEIPAFITRAGEASGNTSAAQSQPGFTGGNHWEVTMFAATAAGVGDIVMAKRRPWESSEPPVETFRVTIRAQ